MAPGASATFNDMKGLALDAAGNLYVADAGNSLIRKLLLQELLVPQQVLIMVLKKG